MRFVAVITLFTLLFLSACSDSTEGKYGVELFDAACARCHGSGLGGGIGPPLGSGSNAATLADEQIAGVIRVGPGAMPTFGGRLSEDQIASLVVYLREQQKS